MKNILFYILAVFSLTISFSQTTAGEYKVENLSINTKYQDFGTTFYDENKVIFSSSRPRPGTILQSKWKENGQPFLDLYEGTINEDGTISDVKLFSNTLNTKFHEATVSFTPDQKTVYFTRDFFVDNKLQKNDFGVTNLAIMKAKVSPDGSWTDIVSLPFNNANYSCGHPSVNKNGTKLYFVSDMPGAIGGTDIFVVDILPNGTYGIPRNLGKKVNTLGKEMFPYIDSKDVLYFSSDSRKDGMGGLDVYAVKIYDKAISDALHLGPPVNSEADDFAYILKNSNSVSEGYFSSNREGGKGDDDIYHFTSSPPLKIECKQWINGVVRNKKTNEILPQATIVIFDDKDNELNSTVSNENGEFKFEIDCDTSYKVIGAKEKFEKDKFTFKSEENPDEIVKINLNLKPIPEVVKVRKKIIVNINPIYFDFDKANIRSDAKIELDKVVEIMNKYPELRIEAGSHTDSRGPDEYNQVLSERRAKSTVKYIISKGIDASRLTSKGYGESQLTNHCNGTVKCTEEEHQQNRRTEFVILNPDVLGYVVEENK
jgi:outer membrane protein OmpA-like peptidoglycan-associated protein